MMGTPRKGDKVSFKTIHAFNSVMIASILTVGLLVIVKKTQICFLLQCLTKKNTKKLQNDFVMYLIKLIPPLSKPFF